MRAHVWIVILGLTGCGTRTALPIVEDPEDVEGAPVQSVTCPEVVVRGDDVRVAGGRLIVAGEGRLTSYAADGSDGQPLTANHVWVWDADDRGVVWETRDCALVRRGLGRSDTTIAIGAASGCIFEDPSPTNLLLHDDALAIVYGRGPVHLYARDGSWERFGPVLSGPDAVLDDQGLVGATAERALAVHRLSGSTPPYVLFDTWNPVGIAHGRPLFAYEEHIFAVDLRLDESGLRLRRNSLFGGTERELVRFDPGVLRASVAIDGDAIVTLEEGYDAIAVTSRRRDGAMPRVLARCPDVSFRRAALAISGDSVYFATDAGIRRAYR